MLQTLSLLVEGVSILKIVLSGFVGLRLLNHQHLDLARDSRNLLVGRRDG